jgi:1-pyrroline-5-carboxylate dehydrogenase
MTTEFRNEPIVLFGTEAERQAMIDALARVQASLGGTHYPIIGGEGVKTTETFTSINPGQTDQVIGLYGKSTTETAEKAMQAALAAFPSWSRFGFAERAGLLLKIAAIMRRKIYDLSAMMILEEGKTWVEAYADAAEAIDFAEFYAREAFRWGGSQPCTPYPGEENEVHYIPLGVGVVIPPWNFPLAIMAGMTMASIVTGNTVVLKPATTAPGICKMWMDIVIEAGLPAGVVNYLPGPGGAIGDYLVTHPKTRYIAFTGSMEVGLRINELAAKLSPGQIWIKRTILEMGGKDTILVHKDANLDDAVAGIISSAYGFQGQKCSACSRAIIHQDVYDYVVDKVAAGAKAIRVGDQRRFESQMGPVIDEKAEKKILEYIEIGKQEGRLLAGGAKAEGPGYYIQPTVFSDIDGKARLSQEEIFGPVLACLKARDVDELFELGNNTMYGLTGSIYSRDRAVLERARHEFHVGNLYFNRKCTGALVGVHPFGGFNMSGTDSKAGGRDYLGLFLQMKSVSEKL